MPEKNEQEIGLQELIQQVRKEMLALNNQDPIFFIDNIELELAVKVVKEGNGGIKISVLTVFEADAGGLLSRERGNTVRVSLSPLLSREDIYKEVVKDQARKDYLMKYAIRAFVKGDDMVGDM